LEAEAAERMRLEIAQAMSRRAVAEKKLEGLQKQLARTFDRDESLRLEGGADDLIRQLESEPGLQVRVAPRLLVDDITPERLADLMAEQGGRLAVLSAEGGIFQTMSGRYSEKRADSLDLFLKGHAGDDMPIDRIGRQTKHLTAPALTMALSVQPEVLVGLAAQPGFRGRGLLARFAYACPASIVGRRDIAPEPVPQRVEAAYKHLIGSIHALPQHGGTLSFSTQASAEFMMFERRLEPRLGIDGDLEHLQD
jgi:hypothetical protein